MNVLNLLNLTTTLSELKLSKSDDNSDSKHDDMPQKTHFSSSFSVSIKFSCLVRHLFEILDLKKNNA